MAFPGTPPYNRGFYAASGTALKRERVTGMNPLFDSSSLLEDPAALRQRFEQDGYVYIPGLLDTEVLLELRRQITDICADCGWLKPGSNPMEAITWRRPIVEGEDDYFEVYDRIQALQDFHALSHEPPVLRLMRALLGDSAFPHPLAIARLVFPEIPEWSTPPHQDYVNNQGTADLFACWIPLSDCPVEMGPVAVLAGSHKLGLLPVEFSLGAGHRQTALPAGAHRLDWVGGDFQLGDAIAFHSLAVHRGLANKSDRMRISVDYRFQAEHQELTERCLQPHFERAQWDEIYRQWDRQDLQYYWRRKSFTVVPFNTELGNLEGDHMKTAVKLERQFNRRRDEIAARYH